MDYEAMDEDSVFDENFDDESDVYSPEKVWACGLFSALPP